MDFVIGHENDQFGLNLSTKLGCEHRNFTTTYRKDGEAAPRIFADYEDLEDKDILFCYRGVQLPDRDIISRYVTNLTRILADLTDKKTYNAKNVDVLLPYFPFSRADHNPRTDQDPVIRERDKGQGMGPSYIARMLKGLGARKIVTFNPHFHRNPGITELEGLEIVVLDGIKPLAEYVVSHDYLEEDAIIISPDKSMSPMSGKGSCLAERFAKHAGREFFCCMDKRRVSDTVVENSNAIDMKGRNVAIVDDMLTSGTTINSAINNMKNTGNIDLYMVHAVLPKEGHDLALSRFGGRLRRLLATNTRKTDWSKVDIYDPIVELYKE